MKLEMSVPCLFGLEGLAADELRRLDMKQVQAENGRVSFEGSETDLARGVDLARALLALPEDDAACFPYPTADGKSWGLVLPLRGFRDALAELAPGI